MPDTAAAAHSPISAIAFSRSTGLPASFGKATETAKTSLPDLVKTDLLLRARREGMTEAEILRIWILEKLYGLEAVVSMQRDQLVRAVANGRESSVNSDTGAE